MMSSKYELTCSLREDKGGGEEKRGKKKKKERGESEMREGQNTVTPQIVTFHCCKLEWSLKLVDACEWTKASSRCIAGGMDKFN